MDNKELINLSTKILEYCNKFDIPLEYLFEILEDQKVTPMIRGKAMEYNAFLPLDKQLPKNIWSVQKLNLNAQVIQMIIASFILSLQRICFLHLRRVLCNDYEQEYALK